MNCLLNVPRFSVLPLRNANSDFKFDFSRNFISAKNTLPLVNFGDRHRRIEMKATSDSTSNAEIIVDRNRRMAVKATSSSVSSAEIDDTDADLEEKSEVYSNNMSEAMGSALVYKHEDGINYNFITSDIIVGSCLQTPEDVDKLREIGVKTIFCLQQNPDLEYFGVDIQAIQAYAKTFDDIEHVRSEIRDFDAHDLRLRLPEVVKNLSTAINRNGGVTYIHCTAGLGRAPSVALAYMYWVQDYKIDEALELLLSKRPCAPKVDAIKSATIDILTGLRKFPAKFSWKSRDCTLVEICGLDIGWGQRTPLKYDEASGTWNLKKELYEGHYEYKYIVDGNWTFNEHELVASPTKDGHVNNFIDVADKDSDGVRKSLQKRLFYDGGDLTTDERKKIKEFLVESFSKEDK